MSFLRQSVKNKKISFLCLREVGFVNFFKASTRTAKQLVIGQFVVKSKQTRLLKHLFLPFTKPPSRIGLWIMGAKFKH